MKPQRPFVVETKRTKTAASKVAREHPVQPEPVTSPGQISARPQPDSADGELALALDMAAQVFGSPRLVTPEAGESLASEAGPIKIGSSDSEAKPQGLRVLPDLLALAREKRVLAEVSVHASKRQRKAKAEGSDVLQAGHTLKKPALQPDPQIAIASARDVSIVATDDEATNPLLNATMADSTSAQSVSSSELIASQTRAALRLMQCPRQSTLPRGERWRERRLPQVCWKRSKRQST